MLFPELKKMFCTLAMYCRKRIILVSSSRGKSREPKFLNDYRTVRAHYHFEIIFSSAGVITSCYFSFIFKGSKKSSDTN
jgi:hypothetical protein